MSETHALPEYYDGSGLYEIRIRGHLDDRWADRFDGLTITLEENGDTLLTGPVIDQAALYGLLKKVRDLGMPLVSVSQIHINETHPYRSKKEIKMNTYRKTAVIVGILFIVGTVSGVLAGTFAAPIQAGSTYPLNISASEIQWIIATLLALLMGLSLAMAPVVLYPILKKHNQVLAFGSVLFRGIFEQVGEILLVISMLLLLTVSGIYGKTGAADPSHFQTLGSMLIAAGDWIQNINGIVFSVGTLMFFVLFYQTRLIPRWLSGWGFIGAVLYVIAKIVSMISPLHLAPEIGVGIGLLLVPTAIQEMVFAVWMIAKGFNPTAIAALSARQSLLGD